MNTDYDMINTELTKNIVNLCKKSKIKKIIYLSGLGVSPNHIIRLFYFKI